MTFWKRNDPTKRTALTVLLASRAESVAGALAQFSLPVTIREAFSTQGVYNALGGCHLAVVDQADLVESPGLTRAALQETLLQANLAVVTSAALAADPAAAEAQAQAAAGSLDKLPSRAVAFVNVAGGVGKTTLALDLALFVQREFKVPVVVVELGYGVSAVKAITNQPNLPHFYDVLEQNTALGKWQGVDLLPMDYKTAQLAAGKPQQTAQLFARLRNSHVLTIFDVNPSHAYWPLARPLVDEVYAVVTTRPDSLANALALLAEYTEARTSGTPDGQRPVKIIANRVRGLADKAALTGVTRVLDLPEIERADRFPGKLAKPLLNVVYPGWQTLLRR